MKLGLKMVTYRIFTFSNFVAIHKQHFRRRAVLKQYPAELQPLIEAILEAKKAIRERGVKPGAHRPNGKHSRYTEEEKQFLIDNYGIIPTKTISEEIGHSVGSVQSTAYKLKITCRNARSLMPLRKQVALPTQRSVKRLNGRPTIKKNSQLAAPLNRPNAIEGKSFASSLKRAKLTQEFMEYYMTHTKVETAAYFNCDLKTVYTTAKSFGMVKGKSRKDNFENNKSFLEVLEKTGKVEEFKKLYLKTSLTKLAKIFNCHEITARRTARRLKIIGQIGQPGRYPLFLTVLEHSNKIEKFKDYFLNHTKKETSKMFGCSEKTVYITAKKLNITGFKKFASKGKSQFLGNRSLFDVLCDAGRIEEFNSLYPSASAAELSNRYNCSQITIRRVAAKLNLPKKQKITEKNNYAKKYN